MVGVLNYWGRVHDPDVAVVVVDGDSSAVSWQGFIKVLGGDPTGGDDKRAETTTDMDAGLGLHEQVRLLLLCRRGGLRGVGVVRDGPDLICVLAERGMDSGAV